MSKSGKIIIAIVIVAVIAVGAILLSGKKSDDKKTASPGNSATENQGSNNSSGEENTAADVTITYDGSSFKLSATTVKSGGKVKVVNSSDEEMEFASNPHPVHTDNPELNTGDIEPGESKTITLTTKGTWGFHNHYQPTHKGEITVE